MFEALPKKQLFNIKTGETGFTIKGGRKTLSMIHRK
jgi:hypothetical protein